VIEVRLVRLRPGAQLPVQARAGDAGFDLVADESALLAPGGGRAVVGTGLSVAIPEGHAGFVLPRSGLALSHGVTVLNAPGLIDSGYRGELRVLLINTDPESPYEVQPGDRIAQLVVQPVEAATFELAEELSPSIRGDQGFGHSGR
jgi:dUTP pyrophosphatase